MIENYNMESEIQYDYKVFIKEFRSRWKNKIQRSNHSNKIKIFEFKDR